MDADETWQELIIRIAKTEAIFAKSNEMQVSFGFRTPPVGEPSNLDSEKMCYT